MSVSEFFYTVLLRPKPLRKLANAIIRKLLPKTVKVHGATISLNPDDPVVSGALSFGVYEREEITFFQKHFRPDRPLVDVGANIGLYTGIALATPGFQSRILCVEPDIESRIFLQATITANLGHLPPASVAVCAYAASDQEGHINFYRNPDNHGDNRLYADDLLQAAGTVETRRLDSLCQQNGIAEIGFLKIDVQGAEERVIRGAQKIIQSSPNLVLMTEFWPEGLLRCGSDPKRYLALLESLNFTLLDSSGQHLTKTRREQLVTNTHGRRYTNIFGVRRE